MIRFKPKIQGDIVGVLNEDPVKDVGEFLTSKAQGKYYVKPPQWDSPDNSIELLKIENEIEHHAMLKLQKQMRESNKRLTISNYTRTQELQKIQDRLRRRFVDVNNFLKECADKKRIADKLVDTESELHEPLREDVRKFKDWISELSQFRETLKATVSELEPYEIVLESVTKKSQIFQSPKDCIDRCNALMLAQVEIHKLEQDKINEIEVMRKNMVKLTNEAALAVLGLKNDLAKLERSYNLARTLVLKAEKIMGSAKDVIQKRMLDKESVNEAVKFLVNLLVKRNACHSSISFPDTDSYMNFIRREVILLADVRQELIKESSKAGATSHEGVSC